MPAGACLSCSHSFLCDECAILELSTLLLTGVGVAFSAMVSSAAVASSHLSFGHAHARLLSAHPWEAPSRARLQSWGRAAGRGCDGRRPVAGHRHSCGFRVLPTLRVVHAASPPAVPAEPRPPCLPHVVPPGGVRGTPFLCWWAVWRSTLVKPLPGSLPSLFLFLSGLFLPDL